MASVNLLAGTVMDASASLMNDTAMTVYTYTAQVPYLRIAANELQEHYQLNAIPATEVTSISINVPIGQTEIIFNGVAPIPSLPDDFIEPQQLWERPQGIDPYIPMTRREYLPHDLDGTEISQFLYYTWADQKINFLPANQPNDIKIDYIKELFPQIVDQGSIINVINARTFLEYRTAGLLAEFIERNITSANSLNAYAVLALDRATGIGVKGKQAINTRRLPFRSAYKRRGFYGR